MHLQESSTCARLRGQRSAPWKPNSPDSPDSCLPCPALSTPKRLEIRESKTNRKANRKNRIEGKKVFDVSLCFCHPSVSPTSCVKWTPSPWISCKKSRETSSDVDRVATFWRICKTGTMMTSWKICLSSSPKPFSERRSKAWTMCTNCEAEIPALLTFFLRSWSSLPMLSLLNFLFSISWSKEIANSWMRANRSCNILSFLLRFHIDVSPLVAVRWVSVVFASYEASATSATAISTCCLLRLAGCSLSSLSSLEFWSVFTKLLRLAMLGGKCCSCIRPNKNIASCQAPPSQRLKLVS